MTTTKDLIEQLRIAGDEVFSTRKKSLIADALERLTQPVGVEPVVWLAGETPLYSAQQVARLQAERDEALAACARLDQRLTDANHLRFREGLERDALQEQVKTLQRLVRNSTEFRLGVPEYEALAATGKEKTECVLTKTPTNRPTSAAPTLRSCVPKWRNCESNSPPRRSGTSAMRSS